MIKALPDSYLPDEADLELYKHMNAMIRDSQSVDRAVAPPKKQFNSIIASLSSSVDGSAQNWSARGHNTTNISVGDTMVNVTDFANSITGNNVQRVYQNITLNT